MRATAAVLCALLRVDPARADCPAGQCGPGKPCSGSTTTATTSFDATTCTKAGCDKADVNRCNDPTASACVVSGGTNKCICENSNVAGANTAYLAGRCLPDKPTCGVAGSAAALKCVECESKDHCAVNFAGARGPADGSDWACGNFKCLPNCQKQLLAKCASSPGQGLLGNKASCNSCIVTNMASLQLSDCSLLQMQSFCALAPDKAAAGATPVPEHNVCSQSQIKAMWPKWDAYCKTPGPKAAATPHSCATLVSSASSASLVNAADPMKQAVAACEAQTGVHCYIFDLDGSRCHGDSETNIFNCRDVPDAQKRIARPNNENWLTYCKAPLPKSYAMTDGCSKGFWDGSGVDNQKKAVQGCEKGSWNDPALVTTPTDVCSATVGDWLDVCKATHIEWDADKCTKAKTLKCKCAPFDVNGAGCAGTAHTYGAGHSAPSAPAHHHHHHYNHHNHHKGGHYKAWDADEEVRAEGSGTASAHSYWPVACVAVAVLAGVALVVRRRQTSELPAAQAAGYGTVPP